MRQKKRVLGEKKVTLDFEGKRSHQRGSILWIGLEGRKRKLLGERQDQGKRRLIRHGTEFVQTSSRKSC